MCETTVSVDLGTCRTCSNAILKVEVEKGSTSIMSLTLVKDMGTQDPEVIETKDYLNNLFRAWMHIGSFCSYYLKFVAWRHRSFLNSPPQF